MKTDKEKLEKIVEVLDGHKAIDPYFETLHKSDFPHVAKQILEALNE